MSVDDHSPATVLHDLALRAETGAVTFTGESGCTVYLEGGQFYFARDGHTEQALATALVRPGRVIEEKWNAALAEAASRPRVGEMLVRNDAISIDRLTSAVLSVVYDPLIRLFRGGAGASEFTPGLMHWIGPFRTFAVDAIVNEVRRQVRQVEDMNPVVPDLEAWVSVARSLPGDALQITVVRDDWELITSLGEPRTISGLATAMGRGQYSTARAVFRLANADLVTVASSRQGAPTRAPPSMPPVPTTPSPSAPPPSDQPTTVENRTSDPE